MTSRLTRSFWICTPQLANRTSLQKLTVPQLVKKFPAFLHSLKTRRSRPCGLLCSACWQLFTDVSGQPIDPIFKGQSNYQHRLRNNSEERRFHLHRGGNLLSRTQRFNTAFKTASHLSVSWDWSVQSTPFQHFSLRSIPFFKPPMSASVHCTDLYLCICHSTVVNNF